MIDKKTVGNRIKTQRLYLGFSQEILGDKLGVSAQAVSKWEQGKSLPDIEILLSMSKVFAITINDILEGINLMMELTNQETTKGEVAFFDRSNAIDDTKWEEEMIAEKWIEMNWEYHKDHIFEHADIAKQINKTDGVILEIGTGPGGGFMPAILLSKPSANVIITDICPTVVLEWKKLLDRKADFPNVHYAVVDNCNLPFKDNSIDVVSSRGGIGNTIGDKEKAINEVYRVLKPKGVFVASEGFVTKETLSTFPEDVQKVLKKKMPEIFEDYYEELVTAGFRTIDTILGSNWSTDDDESEIASLAKQLGIEIVFTGYLRYCMK